MPKAAALQYYHVASMVLNLLRSGATHNSANTGGLSESEYHALLVCGLACANDDPAIILKSFGTLAFCGRYLTSEDHRRGLIAMLL